MALNDLAVALLPETLVKLRDVVVSLVHLVGLYALTKHASCAFGQCSLIRTFEFEYLALRSRDEWPIPSSRSQLRGVFVPAVVMAYIYGLSLKFGEGWPVPTRRAPAGWEYIYIYIYRVTGEPYRSPKTKIECTIYVRSSATGKPCRGENPQRTYNNRCMSENL